MFQLKLLYSPVSYFCHACYMSRRNHCRLFKQCNDVWLRVRIIDSHICKVLLHRVITYFFFGTRCCLHHFLSNGNYIPTESSGYHMTADISVWLMNRMVGRWFHFLPHNHWPWLRHKTRNLCMFVIVLLILSFAFVNNTYYTIYVADIIKVRAKLTEV